MNPHQVSRMELSPEVVDCIVFWTKNPKPMLDRLDELNEYKYYFQFTLTGYGTDIECNVPHKKEAVIPIFQELSNKIGKEKVSMTELGVKTLDKNQLLDFSKQLSRIASKNNMEIGSCAEVIDLEECGIKHNSCIELVYNFNWQI